MEYWKIRKKLPGLRKDGLCSCIYLPLHHSTTPTLHDSNLLGGSK